MDLRTHFFKCLIKEAEKDKNVILLTDDLGYNFIERFQERFPDQFINCGVIEQSMLGIAAGLAETGKRVYAYGGALFLVMRAYEQLRDDICYNDSPVRVVGTNHSGFLGFTHNLEGLEDMEDLLKNLPNLRRYYPKDEKELERAVKNRTPKPLFIRL